MRLCVYRYIYMYTKYTYVYMCAYTYKTYTYNTYIMYTYHSPPPTLHDTSFNFVLSPLQGLNVIHQSLHGRLFYYKRPFGVPSLPHSGCGAKQTFHGAPPKRKTKGRLFTGPQWCISTRDVSQRVGSPTYPHT